MLQFILGRAGSGKTEYIRRMLADQSLAGKGGCVLLVPEQYSFETEKAMLRLAGPQRANAVQIYSFTRLAETVFRREGGVAGRRLNDGGRPTLMSSAVAGSSIPERSRRRGVTCPSPVGSPPRSRVLCSPSRRTFP